MTVPDYITLLWSDDNWGNIRRLPLASERNKTGGVGVYYHVDYVGDPRDLQVDHFKPNFEGACKSKCPLLSIAKQRACGSSMLAISSPTRARLISFINFGWNATHWNVDNLESFVSSWAQRESAVSPVVAETIVDIVRNLTRYNSRRKPELIDTTSTARTNTREADNVLADWAMLKNASTEIDNSLSSDSKAAFSQLIQHPIGPVPTSRTL
ncbi:hypothetical protein H2248_007054 [Termitomyces sp. 'cryptogamus']|nr:hypothetical protein H2248_007054 [Termitomyces sp. 'cryptogamus']